MSICTVQISVGQDQIIDNLDKMPNFINPSFYGFKNSTKIGLLNKFPGQLFSNSLESRYAFANTHFDEQNFSVGVDIYNSTMKNSGYRNTQIALSYVYQLEFHNDWFLYTGLTAGFSSSSYNFSKLIFQDQIDVFSNQINAVSIDPLADNSTVKFFDVGGSMMFHNNKNAILGISLKHINKPKNNVEDDQNYTLDMLMSVQFGYEFDINRFGQNALPRNSYLYLFNVVSRQGRKMRMDFFQNLNLSKFEIGISQHFNYLEEIHIHEFGINSTVHLDYFDFGLTFKMPFGKNAEYFVNNAVSAHIIFDLDPFRAGRRGDFSVFY